MKVEKLHLPEAVDDIKRYVQLDKLRIIPTNTGGEHGSADVYENIKTRKFPKEFLDYLYSSDFVKHLYSETEIQSFYKKWQQ